MIMRKIIKILFITLLIFSCQNSSKNKEQVNKETSTLQSEITNAIKNSAWNTIDIEYGIHTLIDFSSSRFQIVTQKIVGLDLGPIELSLEGDWYIEDDYIVIKYDNNNEVKKSTISDDFSTITNNMGVEFSIVESKKKINLNMNELKAKYASSDISMSKQKENSEQEVPITHLIPQEISYNGKPDLTYYINDKLTVLDDYVSNDYDNNYIRMKFNNEEILLKNIINETSKFHRVYEGSEYNIIFKIEEYGECAGEGSQYFHGEVIIKYKDKSYSTTFQGSDPFYSSKKCQEVGNG